MAWITPTVAGVGALLNLGSGLMGQAANQRSQQQASNLQMIQMLMAQQNAAKQQAQEDLVNKRAVAGTQDSFGTTVRYDPQTNSWVQTLGALPQQADTAAIQANMTRNTTDLMQQELANRVAMQRAAAAGPAADAAQRNLANFRPMTADTLTALMSQQGIEAARQAYDPLRADTLRSVARTGTAAGPVLRQLGLGEAQNLRNTLVDAQLQGLTNAAGINSTNYQRLANQAQTTAALATPQLGQGNLGTSATDQLLAQLTANRAQWAPSSSAQGAYGANMGTQIAGGATGAAAGSIPSSNLGVAQAAGSLKDIGSFASDKGPGGLQGLLTSLGIGGPSPSSIGGGGPVSDAELASNQYYQQQQFAQNPGSEGPWQ